MPLIRPHLVRLVGWAFLLAILVHVDWHLGRPLEMRLSLAWRLHWLLGLIAGAAMAYLLARRVEPGPAWRRLALVGALGFVLGQLVQPALEVVAYGVSFGRVYPSVRWCLFAEFAVAWAAGSALVLGAVIWRQRATTRGRSPDG